MLYNEKISFGHKVAIKIKSLFITDKNVPMNVSRIKTTLPHEEGYLFGNCPSCNSFVHDIQHNCPACNNPLDWLTANKLIKC